MDMKVDEDILFYAFRYALGRMTYAVTDVADVIIANADKLSRKTRDLIDKEIYDAICRKQAGMDIDIKKWNEVRVKIQTVNEAEKWG